MAAVLVILATSALVSWSSAPPVVALPAVAASASASPRARERVNGTALCIVGNLRTFLLPPVHESIHEHLVAGAGGRVDVYVFLTTGHGGRSDGHEEPECSAVPLETALALLKPVHVTVFDGPSRCENVRFGDAECCGGGGLKGLAYLQLSWIDACFAHAHAHAEYSHYMRTRPDLFIGAPPPRWAFEPAHERTLFTMDKDAPASDMFFFFSAALLDTWWRRVSLRCDEVPDQYAEYYAFNSATHKLLHYDRSRCKALPCAPGTEGPVVDVARPPATRARNGVALVQLPAMRNIIVRSAVKLDCYQTGFYCPPLCEAALLKRLRPFMCADLVHGGTPHSIAAAQDDGDVTVIDVPWDGGRERFPAETASPSARPSSLRALRL